MISGRIEINQFSQIRLKIEAEFDAHPKSNATIWR